MARFLAKRLFYGFLVMFGVITIVFFLFAVLPGDPAKMMLGQRSDISSEEAIRKELGLDEPLWKQYIAYLNDLAPLSLHNTQNTESFWFLNPEKYNVKGHVQLSKTTALVLKTPCLRRSYQSKRQVSEILTEAFPKTAMLAVVSILFAIVVGIFIGILCAIFKDSWFDKSALVFSVMGMSAPSFFAAILFAWVFAFLLANYTGLSMFGSLYTVDDFGNGEILDLRNIILPAITLGIRPLAVVIELTRSSVLDVLSQDYVRTAYAKGLSLPKVIKRHVVKNSLNPVVTAVSGWLASMMAGSVFVEYVFDWKGIGVVIVDGLEKYDFPVVMGALLFISVILVVINILVDITYSLIDPRVVNE